jgi:hypothetical protein
MGRVVAYPAQAQPPPATHVSHAIGLEERVCPRGHRQTSRRHRSASSTLRAAANHGRVAKPRPVVRRVLDVTGLSSDVTVEIS